LTPNPHASALPSLNNYSIPSDNPYVGATNFNGSAVSSNSVRTEFWAVGMRNPHRFSFDPPSGNLYLGHVGQDQVEWINLVTKGANCGWNFYEGSKQWTNPLPSGFVLNRPLTQYGHTNNRVCVIGGLVYRGARIPQLYGAYLYAEYGSGELWMLRNSGTNVTQNSIILTNTGAKFTTFGTDTANGDVLIAAARGGTNSTIERVLYNQTIPRITQITMSGANVVIRGANGAPSQPYSVLASTNVTLPVANWPVVATGLFDASGNFIFTNANVPILPSRFYRLQVP
jgi:glucose/arabinose dehydrogenase